MNPRRIHHFIYKPSYSFPVIARQHEREQQRRWWWD